MWNQAREADEIVFVCTGNIIRSAFCDVYSHHLGFSKSIKSFGTTYFHEEIFDKTRRHLKSLGVSDATIDDFHPTHISRHVQHPNSIYFVMTRGHKQSLLDKGFDESKIFFLKEIDGYPDEILDPYYHGKFDQILGELKILIEKLKRYID